jgi:lipooligosaccharide transport system permease protein
MTEGRMVSGNPVPMTIARTTTANDGASRPRTGSPPSLATRIGSVWFRHFRVYTRNFVSNAFPPFLEPVFFLLAIGLGLGAYITRMEGLTYFQFLASGIFVGPAMYTASFECTFGTFIRLEFEKVYDGMLAASITYVDLIIGEILFAATKGAFFSTAVLVVITVFSGGTFPMFPSALLAPIGGFFTGLMFASLSMFVTSFVRNINHFNFYFTGLLTPLFMFSGIVFPLSALPGPARMASDLMPLAHMTRIIRNFCLARFPGWMFLDWLYVIVFSLVLTVLAIVSLKRRLID